MSKLNSVLAIALIGVLALAGSDADADQPENGAQQRQAVQKPATQQPRVAKTRHTSAQAANPTLPARGTQASAKYHDIELKPPGAHEPTANKPKPRTGTYSKTLTFTLSTTNPAPPTPPSNLRAAQAPKGGNDLSMEGITFAHEGFEVQDGSGGSGDVADVAWVSGKGGTRGATVEEQKAKAPVRNAD